MFVQSISVFLLTYSAAIVLWLVLTLMYRRHSRFSKFKDMFKYRCQGSNLCYSKNAKLKWFKIQSFSFSQLSLIFPCKSWNESKKRQQFFCIRELFLKNYDKKHRTGIAEVTGSNPVEALIFSGFFFPIA